MCLTVAGSNSEKPYVSVTAPISYLSATQTDPHIVQLSIFRQNNFRSRLSLPLLRLCSCHLGASSSEFLAAGFQSINLIFSGKLQKEKTVFLWNPEILIRINTLKHLLYFCRIFARKRYLFGRFLFELWRQHGLEDWRTHHQNGSMNMKFSVCDLKNQVTWFPWARKSSMFLRWTVVLAETSTVSSCKVQRHF